MTPRSTQGTLLGALWLAGCQCASEDIAGVESEASSSTSGGSLSGTSTSGDGSTSEPFDASRWLGRYHFENPFLPFGERGDSLGSNALINVELVADARATIVYDDCAFDEAITRAYEWTPGEGGWLDLQPGPGEPWLRFLGSERVESLRVQLFDPGEPCRDRELRFEVDGAINTSLRFFPGESCWVDRCTTPNVMQVDYCDGEQPPACE